MPRAQATKTLSRICERLDDCASVADDKPWRKGMPVQMFTAVRLWVVGSYARGALTCGDLDLVMELAHPSFRPRQVNRLLLKNPQRVSLYLGTPDENTSDAHFAEAVLVWEAGMDWRAALDAIEPDAKAARFDRPSNLIPVRLGQLSGCSWNWVDTMVARHAREELTWQFVPLEEVTVLTESGYKIDYWHDWLYQRAKDRRVGSASQKLLPYMQAYAHLFGDARGRWIFQSQTRVRKGSTLFVLGAAPSVEDVDEPGINTVVVMPHLNARGPNGFWSITRGRNHKLVRVFEGCEAWVIVGENDKPCVVKWGGSAARSFQESIDTFEIFRTEADALEAIAEGGSSCPLEPEDIRGIRHVKAHEFHEILDGCDMLDGGLCWTVFTEKGRRQAAYAGFADDELTCCTIKELADLFRLAVADAMPSTLADTRTSSEVVHLPLAA